MEGSPGPSDLQKQLKEREAEVGVLRDRLGQAQEEMDRLRRENEQLRKELRAAGRGSARGQSKRKAKRKRSGRKAGKGRFTFRGAPATAATNGPPLTPLHKKQLLTYLRLADKRLGLLINFNVARI